MIAYGRTSLEGSIPSLSANFYPIFIELYNLVDHWWTTSLRGTPLERSGEKDRNVIITIIDIETPGARRRRAF